MVTFLHLNVLTHETRSVALHTISPNFQINTRGFDSQDSIKDCKMYVIKGKFTVESWNQMIDECWQALLHSCKSGQIIWEVFHTKFKKVWSEVAIPKDISSRCEIFNMLYPDDLEIIHLILARYYIFFYQ